MMVPGVPESLPDFSFFPWEHGIKPLTVTDKGYELYIDQYTTRYAAKVKKRNLRVFFAKKGNEVTRLLVDSNTNEYLYAATQYDAICTHIDIMALQEDYNGL